MSEKEKAIAERLAKAIEVLPDTVRERLIGYAEGVADAQAEARAKAQKEAAEAT